ncbi:phosphomevalonate kinase [Bombilactobacillus bombi]|uniref:phosphomevalonate kinase n=1 Tax=Bombilactobacillus bombi TaxID=1303590 RepID=UPI0015E5E2E9|nr:phosphomevalonate kinase [Bombilactobacillus bombi]MBA1434992.1 phosphomevalonate kinase [Bombilactobacillus bombi]
MITVHAPGKLYIAGEYAVVEPGYPAIVVAMNQFVTVTIENSYDHGTINSKQYEEMPVRWRRRGNQLIIDNRDNPFEYILSSIKYTEKYALEKHQSLALFNLNVNSQLDADDGKKYGLGSSAAVTVATVKALSEFYHLNLSKEEIFKLAAISHFKVQNNGSFGDIAASVYGGWIAYQSPDRQWLTQMLATQPLSKVIQLDWPQLSIEQLHFPKELNLLIGWSGSPASTPVLVDKIAVARSQQQDKYQQFLEASKDCLQKMIAGFKSGSSNIIKEQIAQNRHLLQQLAQFSEVVIETPKLTKLCEIAIRYGAAAKSSGAGGGDCGIAVIDADPTVKEALLRDWSLHQIQPLNFSVHSLD